MKLDIKLENFEGPLDLLLHLIRSNEMDIWDIQITRICEQYLAILDAMQSLNLDIAGEFLVMASTLLHIKSRLLLPQSEFEEGEEEEEDPRAELVRRLLEYQKYRAAALELDDREILGRDVYARKFTSPELADVDDEDYFEVSLFDLVEALQDILARAPKEAVHEIGFESVSIADRINHILDRLCGRESLSFTELFAERPARRDVVATFLAMLELVRLRTIRLMQADRCGDIWIFPVADGDKASLDAVEDESLGYQ
ncbi:MAG: segregation/condensation protein A [Deltaproteobacteria bacterium]|nr:MAG: segregation/condensation protein A [Deltaproteobacteria bacterium]